MSKFLFNKSTLATYTKKTLEGREYYVAPVVMLTEGVFTANEGALYYGPEPAAESVPSWNTKPIVLDHPTDAVGNFISAADPAVLETTRVGFLLNTSYEGKLKADAWIDIEKATALAPQLIANIEAGVPVEVSTGMVADMIICNGDYNGKSYIGKAVNFRPDHLAILFSKKGACSLADGAGLMVMQDGTPLPEELQKELKTRVDKLVANQLSTSNLRDALRLQLKAYLLVNGQDHYPWIEEVYQTFFIAEINSKLWKIGYTINGDDSVTLDVAGPVEVKRVTEYRTMSGVFVGNEGGSSIMKEKLIAALIANQAFEESDRPMLNTWDEAKLQKLVDKTTAATKETVVVANQQTGPRMTWEEFMGVCPPEWKQTVTRGIQVMNAQVNTDIAFILEETKDQNLYTDSELRAMEPDPLRKLAVALANSRKAREAAQKAAVAPTEQLPPQWQQNVPYYGGAAFGQIPAMLANQEGEEENLPMPSSFASSK